MKSRQERPPAFSLQTDAKNLERNIVVHVVVASTASVATRRGGAERDGPDDPNPPPSSAQTNMPPAALAVEHGQGRVEILQNDLG